ncbi:MAG: terminase small subunit [Alphaproteobacteria bacterium]
MKTTPTAKQQRFIDEYLVDLNATAAAIRAGYSAKTARQIASENLSKHYIQEAVAISVMRPLTSPRPPNMLRPTVTRQGCLTLIRRCLRLSAGLSVMSVAARPR